MKLFKTYIEKSNMESFIKIPKFFLFIVGFWPLGESKFAWIYNLYSTVLFLAPLLFLGSLTVEIWVSVGNFLSVADALFFYMTYFSYIIKLVIFLAKRNRFLSLLDSLENPIFVSHTKEQEIYLNNWLKLVRAYSYFFYTGCYTVSVFYAIIPLLDDNQILPFRGWYPIDVKENLWNRVVIYIFQIICLFLAVSANCSLDVLPSICMNIACAQIEILKNNLETATQKAEQQVNKEEREESKRWIKEFGQNYAELLSPEADKIVQEILAVCVAHHVTIIEFLAIVEKMFSLAMFVQTLNTFITVCVTGFQLIVIAGKSLKYLTTFMYLLAVTFQISGYCWNGHQVTFQSSSIGGSCYKMDWYRCSTIVRKTIFIIMERCKQPIVMTAGNFFTLSIITLTGVLRTSYSYFAVLRRVYNE